jgi:hypothetical protein
LGPDHIRQYQAHLFRDRKLLAGTITSYVAALRFLYVKTLRRPYLPEHIPFPKRPRQLPTVLSPEEVQRVIDSAENLMRRAMLMTLYATPAAQFKRLRRKSPPPVLRSRILCWRHVDRSDLNVVSKFAKLFGQRSGTIDQKFWFGFDALLDVADSERRYGWPPA